MVGGTTGGFSTIGGLFTVGTGAASVGCVSLIGVTACDGTAVTGLCITGGGVSAFGFTLILIG